jgi:hypothetical protein
MSMTGTWSTLGDGEQNEISEWSVNYAHATANDGSGLCPCAHPAAGNRAKHKVKYVRTYIFNIETSTDPRSIKRMIHCFTQLRTSSTRYWRRLLERRRNFYQASCIHAGHRSAISFHSLDSCITIYLYILQSSLHWFWFQDSPTWIALIHHRHDQPPSKYDSLPIVTTLRSSRDFTRTNTTR